MHTNNLALLIIAGGRSSRMGQDKRLLPWRDMSLLENSLAQGKAAGFDEIYLCVETTSPFLTELAEKYAAVLLTDAEQGMGPVSGLYNGLQTMQSPWALAIASDMPFLHPAELIRWAENLPPDKLALLPEAAGQLQTLTAFYHKKAAPFFQTAIAEANLTIYKILAGMPHLQRPFTGSKSIFFNINTPADWRLAQGRAANMQRKIPLIGITAPASGTGKTTFIEKLLPRLAAHGIKTGVVKSDRHGFNLDMQGKDSFRFTQAGAKSVAVISPSGWFMLQKEPQPLPLENLAAKMDGVDLILTESRSQYAQPAISLWRGKEIPQLNEKTAVLFSSHPHTNNPYIYEFHIDDTEKAVEICLFLMGR